MIKATKELSISFKIFEEFISKKSGEIIIDGQIFKKIKGSYLLSNKETKIEFFVDPDSSKLMFNYETKANIIDEVEIHYFKKGIEKGVNNIFIDTDNPYTKKAFIKLGIFAAIFFLIIGLSFNFIFSSWSEIFSGMSLLFNEANGWTTFLFLRIITSPAISALAFIVVLELLFKKRVKFHYVMFAYIVAFFLDQISPFWGPGAIFIVWFLNRTSDKTIRLSEFAISMMLWGVLTNVFALIYTGITIPIAQWYFLDKIDSVHFNVLLWLAWGGVVFIFVNVLFFALVGFSEKFQKFMIWLIVFIFKLIGLKNKAPAIEHEMLFQGKRLKKSYITVFSKWYIIPTLGLIWILGVINGIAMQYSSLQTVRLNETNPLDSMFLLVLIASANNYIPIPGNVGFSEFYLIDIITELFGGSQLDKLDAEKATIIYRSSVTYFPMFIGAIGYFALNFRISLISKRRSSK